MVRVLFKQIRMGPQTRRRATTTASQTVASNTPANSNSTSKAGKKPRMSICFLDVPASQSGVENGNNDDNVAASKKLNSGSNDPHKSNGSSTPSGSNNQILENQAITRSGLRRINSLPLDIDLGDEFSDESDKSIEKSADGMSLIPCPCPRVSVKRERDEILENTSQSTPILTAINQLPFAIPANSTEAERSRMPVGDEQLSFARFKSPSLADKDLFKDVFDLCLKTNISLYKLQKSEFQQFFAKYFDKQVPDLTVIRKEYLEKSFNAKREKLRNMLKDHFIYLIIKDNIDPRYGHIVSLLIGVLDGQPTQSHLYRFCILNELTVTILSQELMSIFQTLWSDGLKFDRLRLLITEDTRLMTDTAKFLKTAFPGLKHITCLLQLLDTICNGFRASSSLIEDYTDTVNRLMSTSPKIAAAFMHRTSCGAQLHPGNLSAGIEWLRTTCAYFDETRLLMQLMSQIGYSTNLKFIEKTVEMLERKDLQQQFMDISGYRGILDAADKLSTVSLSLKEQRATVESLGRRPKRSALIEMTKKALESNPDYHRLFLPSDNGDPNRRNSNPGSDQEKAIDDGHLCSYAPLVAKEGSQAYELFTKLTNEYNSPEVQIKDLAMLTFILYNGNI